MRDLLPEGVFEEIQEQFRAAGKAAASDFEDQREDEDAVTGALGSQLKNRVHGAATVGGKKYTWSTKQRKLRGRGKGAAEKEIGADAVLEIEVRSGDEVVGRKLVPIQAKKEWHGKDARLPEQAAKIATIPGGGLVIDFENDGYLATSAEAAAQAQGNRNALPPDNLRPLGDVLADDFLTCQVGSRQLYYDAHRNLLIHARPDGRLIALRFSAGRRITTTVVSPGPKKRKRTPRLRTAT